MIRRIPRLNLLLFLAGLLLLVAAPQALATVAWNVHSISDTTIDPHGHASVTTVTQGSTAPATDEVQSLSLRAGGGQFHLAYGSEVTGDLPHNVSAGQLQAALEALPSIGAGNVMVTPDGAPFFENFPYRIAFRGALASQDVAQLDAADGAAPLAGELRYQLQIQNVGDEPSDSAIPVKVKVTLPDGMTYLRSTDPGQSTVKCPTASAGDTTFVCTSTYSTGYGFNSSLFFYVEVAPDAEGVLTTEFEIEGGGAAPVQTVDPIIISPEPVFQVDAFDLEPSTAGSLANRAGRNFEQLVTTVDFPTEREPSPLIQDMWPVEDIHEVAVNLPAGLIGDPSSFPQCPLQKLANGGLLNVKPLCVPASQVGLTRVTFGSLGIIGPLPVYNLLPPPGIPARFGFNVLGTIVILDVRVRSEGDYGLQVVATNIPDALPLAGNEVIFWGTPGAPGNDADRSCPDQGTPGEGTPFCKTGVDPSAFFRAPTYCGGDHSAATSARIDSWQHQGTYASRSTFVHHGPGYPYHPSQWGPPVGFEGCEEVPFQPAVRASLTTNRADSPTGLSVDIDFPDGCWEPKTDAAEVEAALCQSDMRKAEVSLPSGVSINPSSAVGRQACTPAQMGAITFDGENDTGAPAGRIHFDKTPVTCPNASKIGRVEISSPLLGVHDATGKPVTDEAGNIVLDPLKGGIYLASQQDNPFDSLLAIYFVAEGSGVTVKQAGEIVLGPDGRITTTFHDTPQQPFSNLHFELFGGPRAVLRTPVSCGTYSTTADLTPWSATGTVRRQMSSDISENCGGGFDPKLFAGTENPLAGTASPFNLRVSRADGTTELAALHVSMPPGLSGYLAGIPYCPDSTLAAISSEPGTGVGEETHPSCPPASRVGTVTVGAGAGPTPFYTNSGRVYLAGPYKGAPISLAAVTPAVAGPLDLGTTVVRNAVYIDPVTAQLSVDSDPLPSILHGIPLDLRDIRFEVNRDHFTLNPTSCEPMSVGSTISSATGSSASPSVRFQAASCERLGFKPTLHFSLKGKNRKGGNPALRALVTYPKGGAYSNIAGVAVTLPATELLENAHIRTICTRVQYVAGPGGGAECPAGSIYGRARAWTPLLDRPLEGPVFLRSSSHELPDLVASLRGQIQIDLVGRIDTVNARIRNTFESVPDTPVGKFELEMAGGKKSLLVNTRNLCKARPQASATFTAHNGRVRETLPSVKVKGCGSKRRGGQRGAK